MNSFILNQAAKLLFPALLILSVIELYRGHNLPGGGFIGGLLAAGAFILLGLGSSMETAARTLKVKPGALLTMGLGIAAASGLLGIFAGKGFMVGLWLPAFHVPFLGDVHLGTPLLFDVGVYFAVVGFSLETVFSLALLAEPGEEEAP